MMELRKGEIEFNIENISLELRRPRTFSQIKILEIHENIEDFHPCFLAHPAGGQETPFYLRVA